MKQGKGTILIVDDEEVVRDITRTILQNFGYNTIEASDGQEALEVYIREKDEIVLVILDIIMPKMGGKETFMKLKETNPDVKVLLSSGYSISGATREILDKGAKGFIQKPYSINELMNKVEEITA